MQLGALESAVNSLSRSGRSPAAKRHLVHFWSENALSGKALKGYCKCLLTRNCQQIVPSHFHVRLMHQRKISFSLSLSHLAIERSKFSPLLICGKVIKSHSEHCIIRLMMPSPTNLVTLTIRLCLLLVPLNSDQCQQNVEMSNDLVDPVLISSPVLFCRIFSQNQKT